MKFFDKLRKLRILIKFIKDNRGALTTGKVIDLMIIALLIGILLPIGFNIIFDPLVNCDVGVNGTIGNCTGVAGNWSSSAGTIWNQLPLLIILAVLLGIIDFFRRRRKG